ncbi:hypothetical protein [Halalkalibacter sp. APA_J-10(15)]|uniref:hypothetical protein n=1 Tax=unclassified Halalkalibacter TaxID=2893063 RepID=UPI001FF61540|nr:hypothetical protein [Halalkalibacter sp. APA_J-10(15)]MCK0472028.1 hypothetical protein [Halalkalibacter sp. APA_J-10(15)]
MNTEEVKKQMPLKKDKPTFSFLYLTSNDRTRCSLNTGNVFAHYFKSTKKVKNQTFLVDFSFFTVFLHTQKLVDFWSPHHLICHWN